MRQSHVSGVAACAALALMMLTVSHNSESQQATSAGRLIVEFKNAHVFWEQFDIAKEIVALHDQRVLPELVDSLNDEDRHARGNVAFVFAGLGDPRGFATISSILADRSDRPEAQGMIFHGGISAPGAEPRPIYRVEAQITADRYYAAHLLGDLKDPRAVPVLIPLLDDPEVNHIVPWALAEIGDKRAVIPLINALENKDPSILVLVIYALERMKATDALPALHALLSDDARSTFGNMVSVADAARNAIAKLEAH
jgi:HEAT repeat protein